MLQDSGRLPGERRVRCEWVSSLQALTPLSLEYETRVGVWLTGEVTFTCREKLVTPHFNEFSSGEIADRQVALQFRGLLFKFCSLTSLL